jgi:peroxiredoxin
MESDKTSDDGLDGSEPLRRGSVSPDGTAAIDRNGNDADGAPPPSGEGPRLSRGGAWLAMGAVALALLLVYLAPGATPPSDDDEVGHEADAAIVGSPAPMHFTLKDMNGVDVKLSSFKGKIVMLNFWATWCPPCKVEIPDLVQLQKQFGDDLVILGVSIDDTPEQLQPFAAEYHVNYPMLVGKDRDDVQEAFGGTWALPSTAIIGRDGKIAQKHTGIRTKEQFENDIKALL